MRIGVLDSGVGGLTVLKTLIETLGAQHYFYFGDEIHMPYGEKTLSQVNQYVTQISDFLYQEEKIDLLVIACNTATVASLSILQKKLPIPVIGMIHPGSRLALRKSDNQHIGVLATRGTVESKAYVEQLKTLQSDCYIAQEACPDFVTLIEKNTIDEKHKKEVIFHHWAKLYAKDHQIDTVILGCTHFPIWQSSFKKALPSIHWINPAEEVAKEAQQYVKEEENEASFTFYVTTEENSFLEHVTQILPYLSKLEVELKLFDWKKEEKKDK